LSAFLTSGIPFGAGIGKGPVDHIVVAAFIDADAVPYFALTGLSS